MAKKKREAPGLVEQLKNAIRNSGLSLTQLSKQAGVAVPQLSRFINGERGLSLTAAGKVCDSLGLRLTEAQPKKTRAAD